MKERDNTELVKRGYEAYGQGDIQRLLGLFSPDIVWELPEVEGIPFMGKRHSVEQVADFFQLLGDLQEAHEFVADEFIAQGDTVVVLGHCSWTVKATGQFYKDEFCHVFRVENGKISGFKEYGDTHSAALAFQPRPGTVGAGTAAAASTRSSVH
jgi:ketosteroid isomerase-like protein